MSIGDWKISEEPLIFNLSCLNDVISDLECKTISHNNIGYKYLHKPGVKINSKRFHDCDISFPGIAVEGAENPYGRRYRIIDGTHRIIKMSTNTDAIESKFYVMPADLFYKLVIEQHSYISDLGIYKCSPIS